MMYSPFSVRDAVKEANPSLVDTIFRRAPHGAKESFEDIYDRWQSIYDTGAQWGEPLAPSVPLTLKRSPDSDKGAQKAITAECEKELFEMYLRVMLMTLPSDLIQSAVTAVCILGTDDDRSIHIAGHDITPEELADAYNAANPKEKKVCV